MKRRNEKQQMYFLADLTPALEQLLFAPRWVGLQMWEFAREMVQIGEQSQSVSLPQLSAGESH